MLRRSARAWWAPLFFVATLLTTLLVIHPLGIAGLMLNAKLSFSAALAVDLPFLPGDVLKGLVAAVAAAAVHRAFPDVLAAEGHAPLMPAEPHTAEPAGLRPGGGAQPVRRSRCRSRRARGGARCSDRSTSCCASRASR